MMHVPGRTYLLQDCIYDGVLSSMVPSTRFAHHFASLNDHFLCIISLILFDEDGVFTYEIPVDYCLSSIGSLLSCHAIDLSTSFDTEFRLCPDFWNVRIGRVSK